MSWKDHKSAIGQSGSEDKQESESEVAIAELDRVFRDLVAGAEEALVLGERMRQESLSNLRQLSQKMEAGYVAPHLEVLIVILLRVRALSLQKDLKRMRVMIMSEKAAYQVGRELHNSMMEDVVNAAEPEPDLSQE